MTACGTVKGSCAEDAESARVGRCMQAWDCQCEKAHTRQVSVTMGSVEGPVKDSQAASAASAM